MVVGAELHALDRNANVRCSRQHDDFGVGVVGLDELQHFNAVHLWHFHIAQDNLIRLHLNRVNRADAVLCRVDPVARSAYQRREHVAEGLFIIHHENCIIFSGHSFRSSTWYFLIPLLQITQAFHRKQVPFCRTSIMIIGDMGENFSSFYKIKLRSVICM